MANSEIRNADRLVNHKNTHKNPPGNPLFVVLEAYELTSDGTPIAESSATFVVAKFLQSPIDAADRRTVVLNLLQRLLDRVTGEKLQGWNLLQTENGAPRLTQNGDPSALRLSISHSGSWLAVAVARNASIGIDIERVHNREKFQEIARFLGWKNEPECLQDFFFRWTLWEACVKCVEGSVLMSRNRAFEALEPEISADCLTVVSKWCAFQRQLKAETCFTIVHESAFPVNWSMKRIELGEFGTGVI